MVRTLSDLVVGVGDRRRSGPFVPDIYLVHGDNPSDQALADAVAAQLVDLAAEPVLVSATELIAWVERVGRIMNRIPLIGRKLPRALPPGSYIVFLSEEMLSIAAVRSALATAMDAFTSRHFRRYFICRDTTPQELRARYPDLAPIYENVTLVEEGELPLVIDDVKRNFTSHVPRVREAIPALRPLYSQSSRVLDLVEKIYPVRLLVAATLAVLLSMNASQALIVPLMLACLYVAGLGLSRVNPLDLWPWLGRCWKWPASLDRLHSPLPLVPGLGPLGTAVMVLGATAMVLTGKTTIGAITFVSGLLVQGVTDAICTVRSRNRFGQARAAYPDDLPANETACDPSRVRTAIDSCARAKNANLTIFLSLIVVADVALVAAARFPKSLAVVWLAVFMLGALTPSALVSVWRAGEAEAHRSLGLTSSYLERIRQGFRSTRETAPYGGLISEASIERFAENENAELQRRTFLRRNDGGPSRRGWFARPDYAFISYVWSDIENVKTAERLDEALTAAGIPFFRDRRAMADPFAVWREPVAAALARCTHVFLVASLAIKNAQVLHREIETVIDRTLAEMLPSVICVVNPNDARLLLDDAQVPVEVRYLLAWCPRMTPAETADGRQLRYIVEHTRRQGKWDDWLTTLSGPAARSRILRMPGIVSSAG